MSTLPTIMARAALALLPMLPLSSHEAAAALLAIPLSQLEDPEQRVELERFYALLEYASKHSEMHHPGLAVVHDWDVEFFDVLGYVIHTSRSVRHSLERFMAHKALWNDGEDFWFEEDAELFHVCWRGMGARRPAHYILGDMIAADLILGTERILGRRIHVHALQLCAPTPVDLTPYLALFEPTTTLSFDASSLKISIPLESMALPMPHADALTHSYFDQLAAQRVARLHPVASSCRGRLYSWLKQELSRGTMSSIHDAAQHMGASSRALQRWLHGEETSFREVADEVRRDLAMHYLEQGLSTQECSWLLDFSEPRAFHRAFKRWTSMTPTQWRMARRAKSPSP